MECSLIDVGGVLCYYQSILVNININTSFGKVLQGIPVVMFLAMALTPQYTLAFSEYAATGSSSPILFDQNSTPAAYMLEAGTVVGVLASAYSSTPDQTDGDPFTTASGTHVRSGVIAANFLPVGTNVRLNGRAYVVEDRMSTRYNDTWRVDIWMSSTETARAFGTQRMILKIMDLP